MGCFLHCFGSSKHTKQRRNAHHHHHVRKASGKPEQSTVSSLQETVLSTDSQVQAKPQEQLNASPRKKVTFDSNVRTYEPVLLADFQPEKSEDLVKKSSQSSENSSLTSTGSYPTNHRYHNCPHSDDEDGEVDYWDSDLTDEEGDGGDGDSDMGEEEEYDDEVGEDIEDGANQVPIPICDEDVKSMGLKNPNARDRSVYVHSVLNPVENLTQWKAVKAKKAPPLMSQEEKNQQESPKKLNKEMAVDASLSNWLVSSEGATANKALYERSSSQGSSNSVISHEDRPILGALTVQEIKQFSTSSSPRKSPIRAVNEMPIIGSVGSYWNFGGYAEDSGSATSFKGVTHGASSRRVYA